jgi:uncharacterized membrane protein
MSAEEEPKHKKNSQKLFKWLSLIGVILCLIGIADTIYLTAAHYETKVTLACPTTSFINCEKVTSSSYSEVLGIPAAVLGLVFFIIMLFFQLPHSWRVSNHYFRLARLLFSIAGVLSVLWFVFVEFQRLDSICLYCTLVHVLTFSLFVLTLVGHSLTSQHETE